MDSLSDNLTFDFIMDKLEEGLVIHNQVGEVVKYNAKALEILKVTEDQLLGKTPFDPQWKMVKEDGSEFTHAENPAIVTINTGKPVIDAVMGIETGKDEMKWIKINSNPMEQKTGTYAVVTFLDITEKYLDEIQANVVLDALGVGIWKYYIQKDLLVWTDSMYDLYEIKRGDFSGDYEAWGSSIHPDDIDFANEEVKRAIEGDKDFDTVFRIVTPSKRTKYMVARAKVIKDALGVPILMLGVNWDITKEREQQKVLEEAKVNAEKFAKAKASFLANMSHEIRTPMNSILGLADMLVDSEIDEDQKEMLDIILRSSHNLLKIINDILDFSAIESGKFTIKAHEFDLHDELHNVVELFNVSAQKKNISFELTLGKEVPKYIESDSVRLIQVISNLLNNAIKFSNKNSKIFINVENQEREVIRFEVKDTGIGLSVDQQKEIFKEFHQADSSRKKAHGGTGLGLSICQNIVKLLGGDIQVESKEGEGSTFIFTVKVKLVDKYKDNQPEKSIKSEVLADEYPHRILVAEDNVDNQRVILSMLKKNGYTPDLVTNGKDAIESCKSNDYTLVMMDLQMPVMGGIDSAEEILKMKPELCIVAVTANVLDPDKEKCKEVGMRGFLGKPFTQAQLIKVIKGEDQVN